MIFDKGRAGLFPFHPTGKKNEAQLIGGSKVRLKDADSLASSFVRVKVKTIVERELADLGRMAACRNQLSGQGGVPRGKLG